ncbi:MAG TPA: hypothetical protein VLT58_12630 [Polyangia bacterium]|nr:hypothetical protein [Polyangia bacterium]
MRKPAVTPLLVAALLSGGAAHAAATQPVAGSTGSRVIAHLDVDAPPECTTREELASRVAARSNRIRFERDAAVTVRVTISRLPGALSVAGELTITRPGAPAAVRRLTAQSCDQASDGLALVIALALDPDSPETAAAPEPPTARPPAVVKPAPAAPPRPTSAPSTIRKARTVWGAEAGAEAIVGPAPRVMPGIRVGARVTRDRTGSTWSPALVLSVVHAWTGELEQAGGTAAFTLDAATLDVCPLRLAADGWEANACGSLLVGRLEAAGSNTYAPASASRPFAAGGASLLMAIGLGPHLLMGARFEAAASLIRDAYAFSPTVFHRAAALTVAGGLWLGLRFR